MQGSKLTHEDLERSLSNAFTQHFGTTGYREEIVDSTHPLLACEEYLQHYEELTSENWLFGNTPTYETVVNEILDWGLLELRVDVKNDIIQDIHVFSDALDLNKTEIFKSEVRNLFIGNKSIII